MLALCALAEAYVLTARGHASHSRLHPVRMGTTADFKTGLTIEFDNSVWKVQEFLHVKPGKGSAFVRSKLKNLETGNTLEKTWKAGESFADAQVDKEEMQYSYMDGEDMVFMNMETYEEERIPKGDIDKAPSTDRGGRRRASLLHLTYISATSRVYRRSLSRRRCSSLSSSGKASRSTCRCRNR